MWPFDDIPMAMAEANYRVDADILLPQTLLVKDGLRVVWAELAEYIDFKPLIPCPLGGPGQCPNIPQTCCQCSDRRKSNFGINWLILSGHPRWPTDINGIIQVLEDFQKSNVSVWVRNIGHNPLYCGKSLTEGPQYFTFNSDDSVRIDVADILLWTKEIPLSLKEVIKNELDNTISAGTPQLW